MEETIKINDIVELDTSVNKVSYNGATILVKKVLTLPEMLSFVDSVVDNCFITNDEGVETYMPELRVFVINYTLLKYYTNVEMPENVLERYMYTLHMDGLIREVTSADYINPIQFQSMMMAIDKKIDYRVKKNIHSFNDAFTAIVNYVLKAMGNLESEFGDFDKESLKKFIAAVGDGTIVNDKIVALTEKSEDNG